MTYQQPYGTPHPAVPPRQPRRAAKWPWLVAAAAVVFAGSGVWLAYDRGLILKDSGVQACKQLASGRASVSGQPKGQKFTEAQYRQMRQVFADSRHDDIRDHGTKLMDAVWQVSQLGDEPGLEALAFVGPLTTHMSGLQSACADQGITVTITPAAAKPADSAVPKCTDVFRPGKTIPKNFGGECLNKDGLPWSPMVETCKGGRKLYSVSTVEGVSGSGFAGGKFTAEDTTREDSAHLKALLTCY